jgi:hypothetical protein
VTAFEKPELITEDYRRLNAELHSTNLAYGVGAGRHADVIKKLVKTLKTTDGLPPSVLDYGAGKRYLAKALPFPIYEYDPAIPAIADSPKPADLVCCLDVLEHIEPDKLLFVLDDLRRCTKQIGYFVINTGPAHKTLPDGRNTHLIQQPEAWWREHLSEFFTIATVKVGGPELHVLVTPTQKKQIKGRDSLMPHVISRNDARMLSFEQLQFRREPYVIGCASDVMDPALYTELEKSFPPLALFKSFGEVNRKWSLSSVNNPDQYAAFLASCEPWVRFHRYVKTELLGQLTTVLRQHDVTWRAPHMTKLKTRWEFSLLPADGGCLRPHTDIPSKLLTVVLSMRPIGDETWLPEWGGGTDVLRPTGETPPDDYKADLSAFEVVHTYPYVPNQAVVFVKSKDSWHSVGPITGPAGALRRTVTINVERAL